MQTEVQQELTRPATFAPRQRIVPRRLRVLHLVSHLGVGGTEHGVLKIIKGLGDQEFEHHICAVRAIDAEFAAHAGRYATVSTVGTAKPGFQFPLFRLVRLMKQVRPDVVHSRNFGAIEAVPAARLARVPVVVHSEHGYELEILGGLPIRRRVVCAAFYALADQVVTVSTELRSYYSRQAWRSSDNVRVIYNGVDTEAFAPRPAATLSTRAGLGIPASRTVIGSVGRLVSIKDYRSLLQAAEKLLQEGRDLQIVLVGSGPEYSNLRNQAEASPLLANRTTFVGASNRIPELVNAMDVFVLPSISEGMSNTVLEAMATGLPVVVSAAGGNPELVEDGRTGFLFAPRDVQALAGHVSRLVADAGFRRRLGDAARQRAVDTFSLSNMVRNYRNLYLDLASRRRAQEEN